MIQQFKEWYRQHLSDPQIVILLTLLVCGFLLIIFLGDMLAPVFAAIVIASAAAQICTPIKS